MRMPKASMHRVPAPPARSGITTTAATASAALSLLLLLTTACRPAIEPPSTAAAKQAVALVVAPRASALSTPALPSRFVVNAMYVALIDDDVPARWASPQRADTCGPDTPVQVDGRPVVEGERVPGPVFTLSWQIDGCRPLGDAGPLLSGRYEVLVMHDDETGPGAVLLSHDELELARAASAPHAPRS